jgi:hypothetical protein
MIIISYIYNENFHSLVMWVDEDDGKKVLINSFLNFHHRLRTFIAHEGPLEKLFYRIMNPFLHLYAHVLLFEHKNIQQ